MRRNLLLVPSVVRALSINVSRYHSALSGPSLKSSNSNRATDVCGKEHSVDFQGVSDLHIIIAKVHPGSHEDEVFHSLVHDRACNAIQLNHDLVDMLICRFKDDWKSALGVFRWAKSHPGYKPLCKSYDMLVDVLGKMRQMDKMRALLEEMRQSGLVTLTTIAKVMRRFAGAGAWEDAVRTFDELRSFGLEKNTESMNLLLDTLCKEGHIEQAREIFLDLKMHIPPNAHTFNMFIHGWCKANRVEEAHWTIQEMKGHGCQPCVISYSTIIQSYCQQSNFPMVYELIDEMQAQGCPPNIVTYTTIMCSLTKSGECEEALQIAERVKSVGCKLDTLFYNALIHTLGKAGKVEEAFHVFEVEMPALGVIPNTSTYNSMITMFCNHAQEGKALDILREMENSPHCKPEVQSYYPLLKLCLKIGKTNSCLSQLLDDMIYKHCLSLDFSTYTLLIHGLCRANKSELAYLMFEKMIGQEITPRYQTCSMLLDEMKQKNKYDAADKIEDLMKQRKTSSREHFKRNRVEYGCS